jgi:hypothetical protein
LEARIPEYDSGIINKEKSVGKFGNMRKFLYLCSILEPRTRSQESR